MLRTWVRQRDRTRARREDAVVDELLDRGDGHELPEDLPLAPLRGRAPAGHRWETSELQLQDTYLDTPSGHLAQHELTLRLRADGPDAGWHLEVPHADGRADIADPSTSEQPPRTLRALVVGAQAGEQLSPVARVGVTRTTHRLRAADGTLLLELADDRVSAVTLGRESRVSSWREVTLRPASEGGAKPARRIAKRLQAAGETLGTSTSRLQRALGGAAPASAPDELDTVGALAWAYLADQCREIARCDIGLRRDEPLVHKYRVAIRRLRSTLRVFDALFDPDEIAVLEAELVWFAGLLGEVRDRDVLQERLAAKIAELPAEVVLGPVAAFVESTLSSERAEHWERAVEAMSGDRYQTLLRLLLRWRTLPPLTAVAGDPAEAVDGYLRRAEKKVTTRLAEAGGDVEALHRARKAAKRHRYAAELAAQAGSKQATRTIKDTTRLQTLLGEHQDSAVSAAFLRRLGAAAGADGGQNGFTYGYLMAREEELARRIRAEAERRWGRKER
ncbi:CYTH and CHAD domain-containing protein [Auraticoccus monumenti]|uniref:CHAD domain-containing protein n=1 Tax=Auraticoccus monumenti TaxID=675864 RepID=A0A1G6WAE4_9ACTN|nr:CYTH and CHAD domain-containing protein [Auraticoccus monumenti]SDD62910.1 CHAD domain-containing protein [Auraticoccus monumenti]